MHPTRISLARLRALQVPVSWQEAVAVARAVGEVSQRTGVPATLDSCFVTPAGVIELTGSASGAFRDNLDAPIFDLLSALLEGQSAPAELRAIVAAHRAGTGEARLDQLDFFSHTLPEREVASLAVRALALEAEAESRQELDRLRGTTMPSAGTPKPVSWKSPLESSWRPLAIVAVGVVLGLGIVGAWWLVTRPADTPAIEAAVGGGGLSASTGLGTALRSPVASVVDTVTTTLNAAADASLRLIGLAPPASTTGAAPAAAVRPRVPDSRRAPASKAGPSALPPSLAMSVEPDSPSAPPGSPSGSVAPTGADDDAPGVTVESDAVYSSQSVNVEPPVLVRPQLPTAPRMDSRAGTSHVELLVDERGDVIQVRLRSTGEPSLNDRMLVSAAKAWQFSPAVKDGMPVKYVVRVPITR